MKNFRFIFILTRSVRIKSNEKFLSFHMKEFWLFALLCQTYHYNCNQNFPKECWYLVLANKNMHGNKSRNKVTMLVIVSFLSRNGLISSILSPATTIRTSKLSNVLEFYVLISWSRWIYSTFFMETLATVDSEVHFFDREASLTQS